LLNWQPSLHNVPMTSANDPTRSEDLRQLLTEVAAGRMSPSAAAEALGRPATTETPADPDVWSLVTDEATPPPATETPNAATLPAPLEPARVVIRSVGHRVRVTGEPSVSTVSVDGPHVVRRDGDTLTVASEGEFGTSLDGFTLIRSRSVSDLRDRLLGLGRELSVRVNPRLLVDVEVTAGSLTVEGLPKLGRVRVTAGSAKLLDADGPLDLLVQAGSAKVSFRPTGDRSRLRVESGSLDVELRSGSDARVRSDTQAGRVQWHGTQHQGGAEEVVLGKGSAVVSLEAIMGAIQVRAA
jgi:hypothetical protein